MDVYEAIINNLAGRVYGVNDGVALSGVENYEKGRKALNQLVADGRVETVGIPIISGHKTGPYYRLRPTFIPYLVVDNQSENEDNTDMVDMV